MSVVSYRLYCESCDRETVVRERDLDRTPWAVNNKYENDGVCPWCNPTADPPSDDDSAEPIDLRSLDGIGETAASNLEQRQLDTVAAIERASDDEILDVPWVGEKGLISLKERAGELPPQKRFEQ